MIGLSLSLPSTALRAILPVIGGELPQSPANTALPAITGTVRQGQTLSASLGSWANSPTAYSYQWLRGSSPIGSATSSTYTLVSDDVGQTIAVRITATNAGGSTNATSASTGTVTALSTEEPETTAYIGNMTVDPDTTRRGHIDTLVKGLKGDGLWSKLDWLVLLAAHDAQAGRLNLKNNKSLTPLNAPTFTVDRGYQGDGAASYLDHGEHFGAGGQFTATSATYGVWVNAMPSGATLKNDMGVAAAGGQLMRLTTGTTSASTRLNAATNVGVSGLGSSTSRLFTATRLNSDLAMYARGDLGGTATSTSPSIPASNALLLLANSYSDHRLAASFIGSHLTAGEVSALHNRLQTYLSAIGAI